MADTISPRRQHALHVTNEQINELIEGYAIA